jgi:hypothetical protein
VVHLTEVRLTRPAHESIGFPFDVPAIRSLTTLQLDATHSPILLSLPGAAIWSFDEDPIARVAYGSLGHVTLTRDFLANPEAYLRHL